MKLDHIGIAVKSIEDASRMYSKIFNSEPIHHEELQSQKVKVVFFNAGNNTKIELLEGTNPESSISKFIERKGEGIHHTAYLVNDIESEIKRMTTEGFIPIQEKPSVGANNKLVFFFHPKSTGGTLIELCQKQ